MSVFLSVVVVVVDDLNGLELAAVADVVDVVVGCILARYAPRIAHGWGISTGPVCLFVRLAFLFPMSVFPSV